MVHRLARRSGNKLCAGCDFPVISGGCGCPREAVQAPNQVHVAQVQGVPSNATVAPFGYPPDGGANVSSNHFEAPECPDCFRKMVLAGMHYVCINEQCPMCGEYQVPPQYDKDGIN